MPKFRKKPVVIEAIRFLGTKGNGLLFDGAAPAWLDKALSSRTVWVYLHDRLAFHTSGGILLGRPGDWIVRDAQGKLNLCKPDTFAATYDEVEDDTLAQDAAFLQGAGVNAPLLGGE